MRSRLRSTLVGLIVAATFTTTFTTATASAPAKAVTGALQPVTITPLRTGTPLTPGGKVTPADTGPIDRGEHDPWTVGECRKDADPGPEQQGGYAIHTSRYSLCTVLRTRYALKDGGTEVAHANFRVTILEDSHRADRKTSIHAILDQWKFVVNPGQDPEETLAQLKEAPLTVTLECSGSQGSSCKGPGDREQRTLTEWQGENDAFAKFDMSHTKPTDPAKDSRAKGFLPGDGVSFHAISATLTDAWGDQVQQSEPLRCDKAYYAVGSGGCVWANTPLIWYIDYREYPEYARHIWDAIKHPTETVPFGAFPGVQIPGDMDAKPTPKPLTRLLASADGNASLDYYNNNEKVRTKACDKLHRGAGQECDEFPLHTTYEGANYSALYPRDKWKYSVRYINGDQNGWAGNDWQSWLAAHRVLAKADQLWVFPFDIPGVANPAGAPVAGKAAPSGTARLTAAERTGAPIPRRELCHHPVMGGWYDCDYGDEWYVYSNGVKQVWVVGADRQVWTRWSRPDGTFVGWQPFGGVATSGVQVVLDDSDGMGAVVRVRGTDGNFWYRERDATTGVWSNWHLR